MEWESGNLYIRPNIMTKGQVIQGHAHNFDHTSIVLMGAIRVRRKDTDVVREFFSPTSALVKTDDPMWARQCHILIEAGVEHEITALEDNTVFWCVYAHRTPQGDVVERFNGWERAYV